MTNVRKKIKHLRSNQTVTVTENGVEKTKPLAPGLDDIDVGEIAINYAAGHEKIYVKNDDNFGGNQEVVGFANDNELNEMGEILSLAISEEKTARENAISGLNRTLLHDLTISTDLINPDYGTGTYYITPAKGYTVIKFNSAIEAGTITGAEICGTINAPRIYVGNAKIDSDGSEIQFEELNVLGTDYNGDTVGTIKLGNTTINTDEDGIHSSGTINAPTIYVGDAVINNTLSVSTISNSDYPVNIGTLETDNITINQDLNINGQIISKDYDGVVRVAGTLIDSQITAKFGIGNATIETFDNEINISTLNATYFTSHSMSDINSINTENLETKNINITGKIVDSVNVSTITLGESKIIASGKTITIENGLNVKGVTDNGVKVGTIQLGNATIHSNNGTIITDALASTKIAVGNATLTSSGNVLKTGNLNVGDNLYAGTISNSTEPVKISTLQTDNLTVNEDLNITGTIVDNVKVGTIQLGNAVIKSKNNTINISNLKSELIQTKNFEIVKTEDGETVGTMLLGNTGIESDGIGTLTILDKQLNINGYNDDGVKTAYIKLGDVTLTSSGTLLKTDYLKVNHDLTVENIRFGPDATLTSSGNELRTYNLKVFNDLSVGDAKIESDEIGTLTIANKQLNIDGYNDDGIQRAIVKLGDAALTSSGTGIETDYLVVNHDLHVGNTKITSEGNKIYISNNLEAVTLNSTTISGRSVSGTNIAGSSLFVDGPNMKIAGKTLDGGTVLVGSIKIGDAVIGAEDSVISLEELNVLGTNYNSGTIGTIQIGNATISATNDIINIGSLSTNGVLSVVGTKEEDGDVIYVGTIKLGDATISATSGTISVDVIKATQEIDVGVARIISIGDKLKTNLYYRPSILTGAGELFENVYTVEETLTKIIASLNSHNILP